MDDFSEIPIKEFFDFRMDGDTKKRVESQSLRRMVLPVLFWVSDWRSVRYRVTPETALRAFHKVVKIGASVEDDQEAKRLWLNLFSAFGVPYGADDNGETITLGAPELLAMPINAYVAYTIAEALKRDDLKAIKKLAHYHEYIEDTGRFRWRVTFADYQPYYKNDDSLKVTDTIFAYGLDTSLKKANDEAWRKVARKWLEQTVSHYTGSMVVAIERGQLTLRHDGLLSAMWFSFWNNTRLYPHPIVKFCRQCGQPIGSDNAKRQLCDDCRLENTRARDREKKRKKRAGV
jgi:hypothetical protein